MRQKDAHHALNRPPQKTYHLLRTRVHVVEDRSRLRRILAHVGAGVESGAQQLGEAQGGSLEGGEDLRLL